MRSFHARKSLTLKGTRSNVEYRVYSVHQSMLDTTRENIEYRVTWLYNHPYLSFTDVGRWVGAKHKGCDSTMVPFEAGVGQSWPEALGETSENSRNYSRSPCPPEDPKTVEDSSTCSRQDARVVFLFVQIVQWKIHLNILNSIKSSFRDISGVNGVYGWSHSQAINREDQRRSASAWQQPLAGPGWSGSSSGRCSWCWGNSFHSSSWLIPHSYWGFSSQICIVCQAIHMFKVLAPAKLTI